MDKEIKATVLKSVKGFCKHTGREYYETTLFTLEEIDIDIDSIKFDINTNQDTRLKH